jgi:hypothetical protein
MINMAWPAKAMHTTKQTNKLSARELYRISTTAGRRILVPTSVDREVSYDHHGSSQRPLISVFYTGADTVSFK